MDRSLFPDGVEVRQTDLANTETTKSFHIRQRQKDSTDPGVVSGFTVTFNTGNNTLIDIAPGTGYAPNGEYVETTVSTTALSLAEYANNQNNYVVAFYTENNVNSRGHETNGLSFPTRATRSVFIRVLNLTEFNTLPSTDENLANTAADRAVLLAVVNANGVGVSLTASDITNATAFQNAISAFNTTNNVSGVTISSIDRTTTTGSGSLIFTTTPDLAWQAPSDSVGSAIVLTGSGPVTLTSNNGKTITVDVDFAAIPGSNQTDTITVSNIYNQTVKSNTAIDEQHRSLIGSGVPTATNPHGITLEDLGVSGGEVEIHQDLFHSNGIDRNSASTVFESAVNATGDDSLDITGLPSGGDAFYLDGAKHTQLIGSNIDWSDISDQNQSLWDIYVVKGLGGQATLEKHKRVQFDNTGTLLEEVVQLRDMSRDMPSGTVTIQFKDSTDDLQFKIAADAGFGPAVAIPTGGAATDGTTLRLFNESGEYYIDVYVADDSNLDWVPIASNQAENLTVEVLPGLETRLHIATVMFDFDSGSDRYLGNGFLDVTNAPRLIVDQRLFGLTGLDDLRDDARLWEDSVSAFPDATPAAITETRDVGIGLKYPRAKLHVKGPATATEILEILESAPNQDTRKRFVEGAGFRGGYILYEGSGNDFILGVHDPDDEDTANDVNVIEIDRTTADVTINETLIVTTTTTNSNAIDATGNGTGSGVDGTGGGSDGSGLKGTGGATNGIGVEGQGTGTGPGVQGTGAGSADGVEGIGGSSGGVGVRGTAGGGNVAGVVGTGSGTASGIIGTGGGTSGIGITGIGGAPDGVGIRGAGVGSGAGVQSDSGGFEVDDTGIRLLIQPFSGQALDSAVFLFSPSEGVVYLGAGGTSTWIIPLLLPESGSITAVNVRLAMDTTASTADIRLYSKGISDSLNTGATLQRSNIGVSVASGAGSNKSADSGAFGTLNINNSTYYYLTVENNSGSDPMLIGRVEIFIDNPFITTWKM